jgi:APA family basic amino acid/polyamine antiporter
MAKKTVETIISGAASVVIPGALSKSELASGMPTSGGSYVFLKRTYGPMVGTLSGLGLWASFLLKSAFALIGFSAYFLAATNLYDTAVYPPILVEYWYFSGD